MSLPFPVSQTVLNFQYPIVEQSKDRKILVQGNYDEYDSVKEDNQIGYLMAENSITHTIMHSSKKTSGSMS